jgi:hypothetical protein
LLLAMAVVLSGCAINVGARAVVKPFFEPINATHRGRGDVYAASRPEWYHYSSNRWDERDLRRFNSRRSDYHRVRVRERPVPVRFEYGISVFRINGEARRSEYRRTTYTRRTYYRTERREKRK